jgi:aminomethyltransferase
MTGTTPSLDTTSVAHDAGAMANYADSHSVVRISAKRFSASPWSRHYADDSSVFGVYGGRLYPLSLGADPVADYWHLRTKVGLFDVPEKPIEISGPDAERFLNALLTRDIAKVPAGKARYALACDDAGRILMDGVVIRWSEDRFWYVLADGDFLGWMRAQAGGLDVEVQDPHVWVLQIQGPLSLEVLDAICDAPASEQLAYFAARPTRVGGQEVLITRTGWTGELGFEIYAGPDVDHDALWEHVMERGAAHGLRCLSLECMGIRRIEAGILDNGTDMDPSLTPYDVGLGGFVDLAKESFIGRDALAGGDTGNRFTGIVGPRAPRPGESLLIDNREVARVRAGAWSPTLEGGIGYALYLEPPGTGEHLLVSAVDGSTFTPHPLPFFDPEKRLARGLPLN